MKKRITPTYFLTIQTPLDLAHRKQFCAFVFFLCQIFIQVKISFGVLDEVQIKDEYFSNKEKCKVILIFPLILLCILHFLCSMSNKTSVVLHTPVSILIVFSLNEAEVIASHCFVGNK